MCNCVFQFSDDAEALGVMVLSVEDKVALIDVIFQDLLAVQSIIKVNYAPICMNVLWLHDPADYVDVILQEKGLCNAEFQEQKDQADFTLWSVYFKLRFVLV